MQDDSPAARPPRLHALRLPVKAAERPDWQRRLGAMAILEHLGVELDLSDEHAVRLRLTRRGPAHQGGLGTAALNGAIIAGMMDCAMSVAGILHFKGRTCGTVQLSIQFMKPVRMAEPVLECYAVRKAPGMVFLEAHLLDAGGRSSASASGVVAVASLRNGSAASAQDANWLAPAGLLPPLECA
ncbi:PaaI family thioesterase [Oxalobacteraceae bacterium]|nr:PaaI family thioesterase [Oxalobacteraceae bacterium]